MNKYIAIMAGGIGSRFWPSSTEERPKQFLDILGVGKSLLRLTYERCIKLVPSEHIFIVTNKKYKELVQQHLPELPERNILCEPSMNNTAPCVAYTALRINAINPQSVFAVLPSDHIILKEEEYLQILGQAFEYAATGDKIITLGIQPTRPDTGYGYINYDRSGLNQGLCKVLSFKEKPDASTAQQYIQSGDYLWNAGMFVWSVLTILHAFEKYAPDITHILQSEKEAFNTDREQDYIDRIYPLTARISIDYAILEKADNVYTIPADIGWSDLGTWNSLHAYLAGSSDQVTIGNHIHLIDCRDIIVRSDNDKVIVIKGLENYIVIDEENALLIYPKSDEQEIKTVVNSLTTA